MDTITTIVEKINHARRLDFGTIFGDSIALFKKTWLQGFLLQMFTLIIMLPLIFIIYLPLIGVIITQSQDGTSDPEAFSGVFAGMSVIYILFIIVAVFALSTISMVLNAGFFRIMKKLDYNETVSTSDFFYYFKAHFFSKTFLLMLMTLLIAVIAILLFYIPIFYVMIPMSYFTVVFAFHPELSVGDIVKVSFRLGHKKWWLTFGLILIGGLLAEIVGFLLCGIGILFTASFVYHPMYLIYKEVIGFEEGPVEIENEPVF